MKEQISGLIDNAINTLPWLQEVKLIRIPMEDKLVWIYPRLFISSAVSDDELARLLRGFLLREMEYAAQQRQHEKQGEKEV